MTQRERQILRWIEENPLISQQELADKAGIARSSVAVHHRNDDWLFGLDGFFDLV